MIIGYVRDSRGTSLTMESQREKLTEIGAETIFSDKAGDSRSGYREMEQTIKPGDTLAICQINRIASTLSDGWEKISELRDRGIIVKILDLGTFDDTPEGKQLSNTLAALARSEKAVRMESAREGKSKAREKGVRVDGRPLAYTDDQINQALQLIHAGATFKQVSSMTLISVSTLARAERRWKAQQKLKQNNGCI